MTFSVSISSPKYSKHNLTSNLRPNKVDKSTSQLEMSFLPLYSMLALKSLHLELSQTVNFPLIELLKRQSVKFK